MPNRMMKRTTKTNVMVTVSSVMIPSRLVAIIQQVLNDFLKMIGYIVLLVSPDMALHVMLCRVPVHLHHLERRPRAVNGLPQQLLNTTPQPKRRAVLLDQQLFWTSQVPFAKWRHPLLTQTMVTCQLHSVG